MKFVTTDTVSTDCLSDLASATISKKAEIIQSFYERVAFHPSGIIYSMQHMDEHAVRPFTSADFEGKYSMNFEKWRLKPDGPWDHVHNENSITTSGIYLASQCYRYMATHDDAALEQARKAFRSLELIFEMGVKDGRPGWMGKPYSWRLSDQTSPDQYLDASWGMLAYHAIAAPVERKRIEAMFIAFADHWRAIDYTLSYFGHHWVVKNATDSYNLILVMLNAIAYRFSRSEVHLNEARRFRSQGAWNRETNIDLIKCDRLNHGGFRPGLETAFKDVLKENEAICWEANIHCKYAVIAIENILAVAPELIQDDAEGAFTRFFKIWRYGVGDDLMPYYWYAIDAANDTWRPLPKTDQLPKDQWLFGHPLLSYLSQIRWMDPLARFMYTAVVAAKRAPAVAIEARSLAVRILEKVDARRLRWMVDPDGKQLIPEIGYAGEVLSSEVAPTFLAAYWRGRLEKLW